MTDSIQSRLLSILDASFADERAYIEHTSPDERARAGTLEQWAPKEILAHLAYWKGLETKRLQIVASGQLAPNYENFQSLNDETFHEHAAIGWDESVTRLTAANQALRDAVSALDDHTLTRPDTVPSPEGSHALIPTILGNSAGHDAEHLPELLLARGDRDGALQLRRQIAQRILDADLGAEENASQRYNLACFLIKMGDRAAALDELRAAFALWPSLVEWASRDSDLDPVRDDPAYQTLLSPTRG